MTIWIWGGILAAVLLGTGVYVQAQGRVGDLYQFLIDRREGAGQTTPDRGADCVYQVSDERSVQVERKAHGHTEQHDVSLAAPLVQPYFGGQQAVLVTTNTIDTYNCTNGELQSHAVVADENDPVRRVLFSPSGRNVALTLNRDGQEAAVQVFTFTLDPGADWNAHFGPLEAGLEGRVVYVRLVGESLLAVVEQPDRSGLALHTYNFRQAHGRNPYNEHDVSTHAPHILNLDASELQVTWRERGRYVVVNGLEYFFGCTPQPPRDPDAKNTLCEWVRTGE